MKISVLSSNLSNNALGRAYILAKVLQRKYDVEIVGPAFEGRIWPPLESESIEYKMIPCSESPRSAFQFLKLPRLVTGDVIYASKPLLASFGIGLFRKITAGKPLILDIDDWEMGFRRRALKERNFTQKLSYLFHSAIGPHTNYSYWNCWLSENLRCGANAITVSNSFLQKRFGGTIVWHGRDTDQFLPEKFDSTEIRSGFNIPENAKVILFLGTPVPYKGIDDLIDAFAKIERDNLRLVLVGLSDNGYSREISKKAEKILGNRFLGFGFEPFEKIPQFMAMADVICIPQRESLATVGQMPAKLFDAMAMGKPVVSSAVSDIPAVLQDCGWVVSPGSPDELQLALEYIFDHPEEACRRGARARQKCEELYSWNAMERALSGVFQEILK